MKDLYIIQSKNTGAIKIGISKNVEKRLSQMQTGSPYELKVILKIEKGGRLEKQLHETLKKHRTTSANKEWFSYESLPYLPDWIYEQLDLEIVDNWWKE